MNQFKRDLTSSTFDRIETNITLNNQILSENLLSYKRLKISALPFDFGDCRICDDKASGIHYGVSTCEGCKVTFL